MHYKISEKSKRAGNFLIDVIAISILSILADIALFYLGFSGLNSQLMGLVVGFPYYFFMESITGKTLGKYLTKTMVIVAGRNSTYCSARGQVFWIFIRTAARFLGWDLISLVFGRGYIFHDLISFTRVVDNLEEEQPSLADELDWQMGFRG